MPGKFSVSDVAICMLIQNMHQDVIIDRKDTTNLSEYDLLVGFYGHTSVGEFYKQFGIQILESFGWATPTERDIQLVYNRIFHFFDFPPPNEQGINVCQVIENMNADDVSSDQQNECFRSAIIYTDDTVGCLIHELNKTSRFLDYVNSRNENGVVLLHDYINTWEWNVLFTGSMGSQGLDKNIKYIVSKYNETYYKADSVDNIVHINKLDSFENLLCLCYETIKDYEYKKARNRKIGMSVLALLGGIYIFKKYKDF
jgi:hypothetical protein